jgi:hypothetical protein
MSQGSEEVDLEEKVSEKAFDPMFQSSINWARSPAGVQAAGGSARSFLFFVWGISRTIQERQAIQVKS